MITGAKCESCVFWSPSRPKFGGASFGFDEAQQGRQGQCRRNSPQIVRTDHGLKSMWPLTMPYGWCGEHAVPVEPAGGAA